MKKSTLRKGFIAILTMALIISGGIAAKTALDFRQEVSDYDLAQETFVTIIEEQTPMATLPTIETPTLETPLAEPEALVETPVEIIPEPEPEPEPLVISLVPDISVDLSGLQEINAHITAWLYVPNTVINYPVLQGDDNQAYLHTTYKGTYSAAGSLFMDYRITGDFTDQNTIIYGHNMSSGTMFGNLDAYTSASYAQTHPYFFLLVDNGYYRYEVCYVMVTSATSDVYTYTFDDTNTFADHISYLSQWSAYNLDVTVTHQDKLVTLSTCTSVSEEQRLVVIGRLDEVSLE